MNAPGVASDTRHSIAYIAVGETCPPLHFYNSFQPVTVCERPRCQNGSETEQNTVATEVEVLEPNSVSDASCNDVENSVCITTLLDEYCKLLKELEIKQKGAKFSSRSFQAISNCVVDCTA